MRCFCLSFLLLPWQNYLIILKKQSKHINIYIEYIIDYCSSPHIAGLTLLGGEPLEQVNQQGLLPLLREFRKKLPNKSIWCFTGFDFEKDVLGYMIKDFPETKELLSYIDVLVDGEFKEDLKDLSLRFKGSSNQRTILLRETLETGTIKLWDDKIK